ncbi:MAG: arginine--tRNA ligase [Candidatus Pacearchaeota archaeon]|jgi:arginyl-tRNA synthetase
MKQKIIKLIEKTLEKEKINLGNIENLIEIPPNPEMGDFAFPCFSLSKIFKKNPNEIAKDLKQKIKLNSEIEKIETKGAYLNFFINKKDFAEEIIKRILNEKQNFRKQKNKKTKMIEFSQANTHKAFHVGHIRGTSLGESLSRISEFLGEKITRANYEGDTGVHVAKWLWCFQKYHKLSELKDNEEWIASIYVEAVKRLERSPKLKFEVEEINRRLELGIDNDLNKLWKKTRKFSLDALEKIYKELNTHFDIYFFESEVEERGKEIVKDLVKKGIAEISDNATIINFEKYGMGVLVFIRRDGTVLYGGKDLALAEKKSIEYPNLEEYIYVVGNEQDLYFRQIFKTLELMKLNIYDKVKNVSFGMVRLPHGKMSSRTGDNILYSDFLREVTDYAKKRISERNKKLGKKELEKRALIVSIAAIKYSMLKQSPNKNIIFEKRDALNFEGDTGPYLLYSFARANSILKKAKSKNKNFEIKKLNSSEIALTKRLSLFPEIVINAHKNYNPSLIANYSYELAKIFNEFYHASPVINSENETFRLNLVKSFKTILGNSLNLLGIETLDEM